MNDPDSFLSRWSRRKHEAGERKDKNEAGDAAAGPAPEIQEGKPVTDAAPVPKFDTESLPSIESISAETDITAFMRAGVPEAVTRAALRRAWTADPAIRDFMGLTENYWDAAGPDGIAGFGDLDPNLDVKRMVSELFGETPRQDPSSESEAGRVANSSDLPIQNPRETITPPQEPSPAVENVSQRTENVAAQIEPSESAPEKKFARRHGGAIPK